MTASIPSPIWPARCVATRNKSDEPSARALHIGCFYCIAARRAAGKTAGTSVAQGFRGRGNFGLSHTAACATPTCAACPCFR
ncbi:hypothetical protein BURMUCGD1_4331 [Burkholderia multivorans CGD1]|nr:hypothetical protein BURMUCGD1_4331 [Burkholderia multivorans CGD1]